MKKLLLILVVLLTGCTIYVNGVPYEVGFSPTGTHTPQSTATETPTQVIPTLTPLYGTPASPPPSLTPTVRIPTQVVVTPTQDFATPENTVIPQPTRTLPSSQVCRIGIRIYALNVRPGPGDFSKVIGQVKNPDQYEVLEVRFIDVYEGRKLTRVDEWAKIRFDGGVGWIAVEYDGFEYAAYLDRDVCQDVIFPAPENITGLHILPGASRTVSIGTIKTAYDPSIGLAWKRANPNGVWVHRSMLVGDMMRDCPEPYEWYNPHIYFERSSKTWNLNADYNEFMNECNTDPKVMADFTIEILRLANEMGTCLLWGSFAAGNPDYTAWKELARVIEWADKNPCRPGKYHHIALHQPMYMPPEIERGEWVLNPHIVERHKQINLLVKAYTGKWLSEHPSGRIFFTEYGLHDGYSGSWDDKFSCSEIAQSWRYSAIRLQEAPYVVGFHYWTFGNGGSIWTDDQHCSEEIEKWN